MHRRLALDQSRNTRIADDVVAALTRGRNCLFLTRRVAHVEALTALLSTRGHQALVLQGTMSTTNDGPAGADSIKLRPATASSSSAPQVYRRRLRRPRRPVPRRRDLLRGPTHSMRQPRHPRPGRMSPRSTTTTTSHTHLMGSDTDRKVPSQGSTPGRGQHETVQNHVSNILLKFGVADRAQAAARARDAGVHRPG